MDFGPDYNGAIIRPPSPTSSIGSTHPLDQTSPSDDESICPQPEFESKWSERIGLGKQREEEEDADRPVLLVRPQTPDSERALFESVLNNLRTEVNQLREDELFERTLLGSSSAAIDQTPSSKDVDAILQSMMPQKDTILPGTGGKARNPFMDTNHSLSMSGRRL